MILKRAQKMVELNFSLTHSTREVGEENCIPMEENTTANDHPFGCNISYLVHLPEGMSRFLIHVSAFETTENLSYFLLFSLFS